MFRGVANHILVIKNENNNPCLIKVKYSNEALINPIKENAEPIDLMQYFKKFRRSVQETSYSGTRIVVSTDGVTKDISFYHNNVLLKTAAQIGRQIRFVATGELIGSSCLSMLNDLPIKKICATDGKYKIGILTECGKLFTIDNFDSDEKYDLASLQILFSDGETVVDINCTSDSIVALTETGNVYRINQDPSNKVYPIDIPVKISENIGRVAEIGCHQYRTIMKTCNGEFYSDNINSDAEEKDSVVGVCGFLYRTLIHKKTEPDFRIHRLNAFNGINIVKFDCNNYYTIALDDKGDLYIHYIEEYGIGADAKLTKLDIELYKFPSKTTKSASY